MAGVMVTQGTSLNIKSTTIGTQEYQHVVLNLGTSADSPFGGTISNIGAGTITALAKGTISAGTIDKGTVDAISQMPPNYFWNVATTGTTTLGTIKAAVAGSAIFVTDLIVSVGTLATTVVIGMGGTSTPLIGTLSFAANGGMVSNFRVPGSVTSGSALVYQQSVGIPLTVTAGGFVR